MNNEINCNDPLAIITHVLDDMQKEQGKEFDIEKVNLAELERRTGISRSRLRTLKSKGFKIGAHGLTGRKAATTVLSGFTGVIDSQLKEGVTNSAVILSHFAEIKLTSQSKTVNAKYIEIIYFWNEDFTLANWANSLFAHISIGNSFKHMREP